MIQVFHRIGHTFYQTSILYVEAVQIDLAILIQSRKSRKSSKSNRGVVKRWLKKLAVGQKWLSSEIQRSLGKPQNVLKVSGRIGLSFKRFYKPVVLQYRIFVPGLAWALLGVDVLCSGSEGQQLSIGAWFRRRERKMERERRERKLFA